MGRIVIRIPRRNCKEGPWEYFDDQGIKKEGSLVDAANSYSVKLTGQEVDAPGMTSLSMVFTRRRWRGKDKRQNPHGVKGKLTIVRETSDEN